MAPIGDNDLDLTVGRRHSLGATAVVRRRRGV